MTSEPTEPAGPPRLFAYGTLAPGRPNARLLADTPGTWEPATTPGCLVHEGWGATLGYPALVLDPHSTEVVSGMLLTSQDLSRQWEVLDAFEGPAYERVNIIVTKTDGTERSAQTYALRPNP
jgi:gamma-glutamylcyclotransferase (GGCT)/AIG2-like uncharacterized protein YtfP